MKNKVILSICIATYNRGDFISETLDSIINQITPDVEIVIVDGASSDNTSEIVQQYQLKMPNIRYFREEINSGVDADFDKAVGYANGEFCWLMTDDDLLVQGAISEVLNSLTSKNDLVIINSELRNKDLSKIYEERRLNLAYDKEYHELNKNMFFSELGSYLSFIGCVVIRKSVWLARDRISYYGSLFVHVGVIFQTPPISKVKVIATPLIVVRYGNAMWTPRAFEIWMFKWPNLIWSFNDFSDQSKASINQYEPWRNLVSLFYYRGLGAYNFKKFRHLIPKNVGILNLILAFIISVFPATLANILMLIFFVKARQSKMVLHDFLYALSASKFTRFLASLLRLEKI